MKEFYFEMAETKKNQLDMARIGYARKCHEIASKLMSCTVSESYQLIKELDDVSYAYKDLENEYNNLVKRYQEEAPDVEQREGVDYICEPGEGGQS